MSTTLPSIQKTKCDLCSQVGTAWTQKPAKGLRLCPHSPLWVMREKGQVTAGMVMVWLCEYHKICHEIEQHLGKALLYPLLPDGSVCVNEYSLETLAVQAAARMEWLRQKNAALEAELQRLRFCAYEV